MMKRYELARLERNIDKAKQVLDEALQRTQEFSYKDWDAGKVKELIIKIKTALNQVQQEGEIDGKYIES